MKASVIGSDGLSEVEGGYDWIVSNPPFHTGVEQDTSIAHDFIQDARGRLHRKGRLVLVANRHLPYSSWLDQVFGHHELLHRDTRYHVLAASN